MHHSFIDLLIQLFITLSIKQINMENNRWYLKFLKHKIDNNSNS